jgi:hypothetical protein
VLFAASCAVYMLFAALNVVYVHSQPYVDRTLTVSLTAVSVSPVHCYTAHILR